MQQGKLVEVGPCAEVLRKPQHAYTKQLLAALPENLIKPVLVQSQHQTEPLRTTQCRCCKSVT